MSKSKGNERLAANRRRILEAAGYTETWDGKWAAPGEPKAWRSLLGAWRRYEDRCARGVSQRYEDLHGSWRRT